jgi:hypothetical protein
MPSTNQSDSDPVLADWNAYYQLLLTGKLKEYSGRFIVVYQGKVVAAGEDPAKLRSTQSL